MQGFNQSTIIETCGQKLHSVRRPARRRVFFIVLFATGGMLSTVKTMPAVVLKIHQIMPFLVLVRKQ